MKKENFYSSGELAAKAHITKKTIRYYDEKGILKPSYLTDYGARFYSEQDLAKLEQILFLKYLSFSLDDIKEMTIRENTEEYWSQTLKLQRQLIDERINQLIAMRDSISAVCDDISSGEAVDWEEMFRLVDSNVLENQLKRQYLNASNISARIRLHSDYSQNPEKWFNWLYREIGIASGARVLELGCGDASLWTENEDRIPADIRVTLTDISSGLVNDIPRRWKGMPANFNCEVMDIQHINAPDETFDIVIANHVLFYCTDLQKALSEVRRVLRKGGVFICSTYGAGHMKEIRELAKNFDDRITLSGEPLYEIFGAGNGSRILEDFFRDIRWIPYDDCLIIDKPEPLIAYILSCHGNQNHYIIDKYSEFYAAVKQKTDRKFRVTKEAGIFISKK